MNAPHDPIEAPATEAGREHLDYIRRWSEDEGATWTDFDTEELGGRIRKIEQQARDEGRREAVRLRVLLWLHHGHDGLYGDDGEMQCNHGVYPTDFQRSPIEVIEEHLNPLMAGLNASESPPTPDYIIEVVGNGDGTMNVLTESGMRWRLTEDEYRAWPHRDASESPPTLTRDDLDALNRASMERIAPPMLAVDASESPPTRYRDPTTRGGETPETMEALGDASESGQPEKPCRHCGYPEGHRDASESPPTHGSRRIRDARGNLGPLKALPAERQPGDASESNQPPRHMHGWGEICDSECPAWSGQPPETSD